MTSMGLYPIFTFYRVKTHTDTKCEMNIQIFIKVKIKPKSYNCARRIRI